MTPNWQGPLFLDLIRAPEHFDVMIVKLETKKKNGRKIKAEALWINQAFQPEADPNTYYSSKWRKTFNPTNENMHIYKVSGTVTESRAFTQNKGTAKEGAAVGLYMAVPPKDRESWDNASWAQKR